MRHVIGSTADKRRSHPTTSSSPTPNHTDTRHRHRHTHAYTHAYASLSMNRRGLNEKAGMFLRSSVHEPHLIKVPRTPRSAGVWQLGDG